MLLSKNSGRIGEQGESNLQLTLQSIAYVNKYSMDIGLDFFCELRCDPSLIFYVQSKATEAPKQDQNYIETPYAIKLSKIENYWLKKAHPVYVIVTDLSNPSLAYYLIINQDTLNNPTFIKLRNKGQKIIFRIPLSNKIHYNEQNTTFQEEIINNQPLSSDIKYGKISESDSDMLEIMRSSDQSLQVDVKNIIKNNILKYKTNLKFKESLKDIFINCKDRINQIHITDIFVIIEYKEVINEIINQIGRNIKLDEYQITRDEMKYTYSSFLFNALVNLNAPKSIFENIKHFLKYNEVNLTRDVIRTIGELKINKGKNIVFGYFKDLQKDIRWESYTSISKFSGKDINNKLLRIIIKSNNVNEISSAIYCCELKKSRNKRILSSIINKRDNNEPKIRVSIANYLGTVRHELRFAYLINLLFDEVHDVRQESLRSLLKLDNNEIINLEEMIQKQFCANNDLLFKSDLLSALFKFATNNSETFIKNIIENERFDSEYKFFDIYGSECIAFIDLGGNSVRTLVNITGRESVPFLLKCISNNSSEQYKLKVISALGDLKDKRSIEKLNELASSTNKGISFWAKNSLNKINTLHNREDG